MRVMIAIDSSPASRQVLEEAVARPWPSGTSFCVVHSVDVVPLAELPVLVDDARREAAQLLESRIGKLAVLHPTVQSQVLVGHPRKAISDYAREWRADFILLGSHGHSAAARFLLGSVAQGVLKTAHCSVEIVRFPANHTPPSAGPMKVLIATDGSVCSLAAATSVAERPWPDGTAFRILSVEELVNLDAPMAGSSLSAIYPASLLEELMTDARARAAGAEQAASEILHRAGLRTLGAGQMPCGDPRAVILDSASAWPADLIVLGSHGRRGLDRFLMGSVAESVAVHARCSVEVVRN